MKNDYVLHIIVLKYIKKKFVFKNLYFIIIQGVSIIHRKETQFYNEINVCLKQERPHLDKKSGCEGT